MDNFDNEQQLPNEPMIFMKDVSVRPVVDGKQQLKKSLLLLTLYWIIFIIFYAVSYATDNHEVSLYGLFLGFLGVIVANYLLFSKKISLQYLPDTNSFQLVYDGKEISWQPNEISAIHIGVASGRNDKGFLFPTKVEFLVKQDFFAVKIRQSNVVDKLYEFEGYRQYFDRVHDSEENHLSNTTTFFDKEEIRTKHSGGRKILFIFLLLFLAVIGLLIFVEVSVKFKSLGLVVGFIFLSFWFLLSKYVVALLYDRLTQNKLTLNFDEATQRFRYSDENEAFEMPLSEISRVEGKFPPIVLIPGLSSNMKMEFKMKDKTYNFSTNNLKTRGKLEYFYHWLENNRERR